MEHEPNATAVDTLAPLSAKSSDRILEPMDRISEVLFGLIMALTFTLTLGVVTADSIQVRTMLLAALGCNLFVSTFPIVIPFILIGDARLALRFSNAVAIAMLFVCGYAFGRCAGFRPWATGLLMVAVGAALVGIAIALGG